VLLGALVVSGFALVAPGAGAAPTTMVALGSASTFAVLSGASIGNTVSAPGDPHTTLRGDLGVVASSQPTGFPPGVVTGAVDVADAAAVQAGVDALAAYTAIAARTGGAPLAGALAGATITPGLYSIAGAASNTTTVTLDAQGDPNAVFVFQVNGALTTAALSHIVLANGALASRVFWQVNGAAAIGAGASFAGTMLALNAVAVGHGSVVNGRVVALNGALTLDDNELYSAPPLVTINGGQNAITTDTTPTISGTTDITPPALVTVTINGQTLTTTPTAGAWSVTSTILANNAYPITASVTDGAGNPASATQQLTVDTLPPQITIDGGPSVTTNDPTPTITGTSDVAPATIIHLTIGPLAITTLVQPGGAWNATPTTLPDNTYTVTATVTDPAGNPNTQSQTLTVDTTPPALTISGGVSALTNDATPTISGTAAVAPGAIVTVGLADETLTGIVLTGGSWSVTPAFLGDGTHRVILGVFDAAGNYATFTQTLTVDTVAPAVSITGGATAAATVFRPTITGTSSAAAGTIVTVTIAGRTMTTLLQADGTWNATPPLLADGAWAVIASAEDPAGNLGSATQTLTIDSRGDDPTGGTGPTLTPVTPPPVTDTSATSIPSSVTPVAPTTLPLVPAPDRRSTFNAVATTTVTRNTRQTIKGSTLSIGTRVTAPAGGRIVATASGTVKIGGIAHAITLTTATTALHAGRSATLSLIPKGTNEAANAAVTRLKAIARTGKKVIATITIKIADAAGHTRTITRTVTLT
jgi:Ice-binding-like/Bacterial Ig-like domain